MEITLTGKVEKTNSPRWMAFTPEDTSFGGWRSIPADSGLKEGDVVTVTLTVAGESKLEAVA